MLLNSIFKLKNKQNSREDSYPHLVRYWTSHKQYLSLAYLSESILKDRKKNDRWKRRHQITNAFCVRLHIDREKKIEEMTNDLQKRTEKFQNNVTVPKIKWKIVFSVLCSVCLNANAQNTHISLCVCTKQFVVTRRM